MPAICREYLLDTLTVTPSIRSPEAPPGGPQGIAGQPRLTPHVHSAGRALEPEDALAQLDLGVHLTGLLVSTVHGSGRVHGVPLDIERDRHEFAVGATECLVGIVEQHAVCLVSERPLLKRFVAEVACPHLRGLDLEALPQPGAVEFHDVQVRLTGPHQSGPIVEPLAGDLEPYVEARRCVGVPSPEPPRLDRLSGMTCLVCGHPRGHRGNWRSRHTGHGVERYPTGQNRNVRYLSLEWIDALTAAVAADEAMQRAAAENTIAITQVVTGTPEGDVTYHLAVSEGRAVFGPGAAVDEDLRMMQDWATAVGVATRTLNPQDALIDGRIRLGGDPMKLMAAESLFAALDGIFNEVSKHTTYDWPNQN